MENSVYCYRAVKRVPGGVVPTSGLASEAFFCLISQIDHVTVCAYGIFICMVLWKGSTVTSTLIIKHEYKFGKTPVGAIMS